METKQTAVEWFFDKLENHEIQAKHYNLYQQAKQMEKEQMLDFAYKVIQYSNCSFTGIAYCDNVEEIFNETYGKN